ACSRRDWAMRERTNCYCRLCRIERDLLRQSASEVSAREYQILVEICPALARFPRSPDLLAHLHASEISAVGTISADWVFRELIQAKNRFPNLTTIDDLFTLAFVPVIHGTLRQIFKRHPLISPEDGGQHAILSLLEFLRSQALRTRESHFAFAISRRIKRSLFEWAERESRTSVEDCRSADEPAGESFERCAQLHHFLHTAVAKRRMTEKELALLLQFKIDGSSGQELGMSANALRQRAKRLLTKLRSLARGPQGSKAETELFC